MPAPFELNSYAKINWMLRVLGKRDDGFHELCTVFQTVSLYDTLHFESAEELVLTCDDSSIPLDESNLILRAARMLAAASSVPTAAGAGLHLEKRIPSPGGLGGGSSNAATTLIGLNRLWRLGLTHAELCEIAAALGSDVPFFLYGGTAIGTGRGEKVASAADVPAERYIVIVTPAIAVRTPDAFRGLNASALTPAVLKTTISVCSDEAFLPRSSLINDLEPSVFAAHPEVKRVKGTLLDLGAVNAAMSGSGASVFAIFDKEETRQAALKALDIESTWRKFAVSTVSRDIYRESLGI